MKAVKYVSSTFNVTYIPSFLDSNISRDLFYLCENLSWKNKDRRCNLTFGEDGFYYKVTIRNNSYNRKMISWDSFPILNELKLLAETETGCKFNCCAIMRYPNKSVGIKRHRDKEMIDGSTICGISLGNIRTLKLYPPKFGDSKEVDLKLLPGSMYILKPPTNSYWTHEIPSEISNNSSNEIRFSLTFRDAPLEAMNKEDMKNTKEVDYFKHTYIKKNEVNNTLLCNAILKSGKRKGEMCKNIVKNRDLTKCGHHKNI